MGHFLFHELELLNGKYSQKLHFLLNMVRKDAHFFTRVENFGACLSIGSTRPRQRDVLTR